LSIRHRHRTPRILSGASKRKKAANELAAFSD
jgi:hypothetical protein